MSTITAAELLAKHQAGEKIELIDVRMPTEFRETHVTFARNVPLDSLDPRALQNVQGPLYVVCQGGTRSKMACDKLRTAGFTNIVDVLGGTKACVAAGLPVVKGKKTISLERQVRIVAGSLVVLGVVLSLTVHPWLIGISAFVGSGLVFAGVTDTCGMGMMLSKTPWNRVADDSGTCAVKPS